MLSTEQAKEYLNGQGITLPDFIVNALVEQVNTIDSCLSEHYTPAVALLIQSYLLGLMSMGDKYISSQTAPSGASQSFRYQSFADRWQGLLSLLRNADKHGCTAGLVPPDPTKTAAGFWVATGSKMCGGAN